MMEDINVYKRRYDREKTARIEAESILESKSRELYLVNEQLKTLTADLESIINERTAELQMAHDQAIASSQAKGLFLANMSHEIRTPMNGVLGVLHLLQKTPLNERQKQLMETARHSGELLLAIINDILDVSKIEAGELVLEKIDFDLPRVLVTMLDSFSHEADKKSLQLLLDLDPKLPHRVQGDPTRLRQVIANLLSNAIKFTPEGYIKLSGRLVETPDNDDLEQAFSGEGYWIEISVTDTGIGISPEKIQQVFSPFTQADESITRQYGGTGLGLAICTHLTQSMGQKIKVTSELNKGTQFSFLLFAEKSTSTDSAEIESHETSTIFFPQGKVMLVDDNPVNREIAQAILEQHGLTVVAFENGKLALDNIQTTTYDAVLMDIQMPVMDGLTATTKIRALTLPQANTPIVAMTAHAGREDIAKSMAAGMNGHLTKPLQPEKLIETLTQWIKFEHRQTADTGIASHSAVNIPVIAGLAVREALTRANNNIELFNKTLDRFVFQHQSDILQMERYLVNSEIADVQKLAHRLKGSSLSIGAKNLADIAHQLETSCKLHNTEHLTPQLAALSQQLSGIISSITHYQASLPQVKRPSKIQAPLTSENFQAFYMSCNTDLKNAEVALAQIISGLPSAISPEELQNLFDQFQMEDLVARLQDIERSLFSPKPKH